MEIADQWQDYQILLTSNGEKLEKWGKYYLLRPDPQIIWKSNNDINKLVNIDAHYIRSSSGGGMWQMYQQIPEEWTVHYKDLSFYIKPMGFKHTGLFPEQAYNWDLMRDLIKKAKRPIKVLNLFAYTGGASVACAKENAHVTHVDCVKQIVERAKMNMQLNHIDETKVRYIIDDCKKFVEREIRRNNHYDAIIMDPPSFGRSGNKTVWKLENDLFDFVKLCCQLLNDKPLFVLINSYTTGFSETVAENILRINLKGKKGSYRSYEIGLPTSEGICLPCGSSSLFIGEE